MIFSKKSILVFFSLLVVAFFFSYLVAFAEVQEPSSSVGAWQTVSDTTSENGGGSETESFTQYISTSTDSDFSTSTWRLRWKGDFSNMNGDAAIAFDNDTGNLNCYAEVSLHDLSVGATTGFLNTGGFGECDQIFTNGVALQGTKVKRLDTDTFEWFYASSTSLGFQIIGPLHFVLSSNFDTGSFTLDGVGTDDYPYPGCWGDGWDEDDCGQAGTKTDSNMDDMYFVLAEDGEVPTSDLSIVNPEDGSTGVSDFNNWIATTSLIDSDIGEDRTIRIYKSTSSTEVDNKDGFWDSVTIENIADGTYLIPKIQSLDEGQTYFAKPYLMDEDHNEVASGDRISFTMASDQTFSDDDWLVEPVFPFNQTVDDGFSFWEVDVQAPLGHQVFIWYSTSTDPKADFENVDASSQLSGRDGAYSVTLSRSTSSFEYLDTQYNALVELREVTGLATSTVRATSTFQFTPTDDPVFEESKGLTEAGKQYLRFRNALSDKFPWDLLFAIRDLSDSRSMPTSTPLTVTWATSSVFASSSAVTWTLLDEATFKNNLGGQESYDTLRTYFLYFIYFAFVLMLIRAGYELVRYITTSET